jgi:predicted dehydrogenase/threonine dehydrogenase-like Zn-dependent dehydrogenase
MKQILQSLKTGKTEISTLPVPQPSSGKILIKTCKTLVSSGTERMLVDFGKSSLLNKARKQPDKVKMVFDKIKSDGFRPTIEAVLSKLDQPLPLGYCNVGKVNSVEVNQMGFSVGDRVISNGSHAEVVNVPFNLCAKIPDSVKDEEAAFTVLGSIALQGVRLLNPALGEAVVVVGLGLVGLITVQLLRANGCRVLGLDYDEHKLEKAKFFGAEVFNLSTGCSPIKSAEIFSRGRGVDGVIITAASTSNKPVHEAALMCRKRGRIILVGVAGLQLSREDFFKKELTFQVSASYGPGRYDPNYEDKGQDYPVGFVRWTEQRNFEAILDMMEMGKLDVRSLISHQFELNEAAKAYELISGSSSSLGILINYPATEITSDSRVITLLPKQKLPHNDQPAISFIGSGNYATGTLIPAFKRAGANLSYVASGNGVTGLHAGRKFGFDKTTTDIDVILQDNNTDAVVVTTRHNSHAQFVCNSLVAGKHVFVEKPLCLTFEELDKIQQIYSNLQSPRLIMVGYNRRFSPHVQQIKNLLRDNNGPKSFVYTINSGHIDIGHWLQDIEIGGGRIIGEVCHFIDLLRYLTASPIVGYSKSIMSSRGNDTVSLTLNFQDGSIGAINYFSNGPKSLSKERLEVFSQGRVLQLDNFRKLKGFSWPGFSKMNLWTQDKGQKNCAQKFLDAVSGKSVTPIPVEEIFEVAKVSIQIAKDHS